MKARPTADYPVRVVREANEVLAANAAYYEGIYSVILNQTVQVVFVPDVSAQAPPWDGHQLPADLDLVATAEQARIEMVVWAQYAVTPNAPLAGQVEQIPGRPPPADGADRPPTPQEQ